MFVGDLVFDWKRQCQVVGRREAYGQELSQHRLLLALAKFFLFFFFVLRVCLIC